MRNSWTPDLESARRPKDALGALLLCGSGLALPFDRVAEIREEPDSQAEEPRPWT